MILLKHLNVKLVPACIVLMKPISLELRVLNQNNQLGAVMDRLSFKGLFNRSSSSNERRTKQRAPKDRVIKVLVVEG